MTRADLINLIIDKVDMKIEDIDDCTKYVFEFLSNKLEEGQRIEIRGFGSFSLRYRASRIARNPKSGEELFTKGKYVVHFKQGKELKDRMNSEIP